MSPYQLLDEKFVGIVRNTVDRVDIKPWQLELEITETTVMASLENTSRNLNTLNKMGVRLSLDDFGTGYSSLTYLHRLPVKTLKIDKSFIDRILTDKAHAAIIGSIVTMAHSMDITVVAEGVETSHQLDFLTNHCCDLIQGYFFSRPMTEEAAVQFLLDHR